VEEPSTQVDVEVHHPQPSRPVHAVHVLSPPQVSPESQEEEYQSQSVQVPVVGPAEEPVMQSSEVSHQPQPLKLVQSSQTVSSSQGSVPQAVRSHRHSEQVPREGPVVVPVMHASLVSHHPHPLRRVHVSHAVEVAQGSAESHAEESHPQSVQVPEEGPPVAPAIHRLVTRHQPHPGAAMQRAHSVNAGQGSELDVHRPPVQERPAQQSAAMEQV